MQYKTIVLELLQQRPLVCRRLRKQRKMLEAINHYALDMKIDHESIIQAMLLARPHANPIQIASEALEIALQHLEEALPCESDQEGEDRISLDQAMAFLLKDSLPA